jgi:hypothetical protein
MDLSLQQLQRALSIKEQIAKLERQYSKLFSGASTDGSGTPKKQRRGKRTMSAAAKAKIAASKKKWWADRKAGKSSAKATKRKRH